MTDFLQVSSLHNMYYEQCGNPSGHPVLFLHGGPGGGTGMVDRRYFDPSFYRIILIHQRGAGQSTPHACLVDNTTQHLIADIEMLREKLLIDKWVVFGGSWGSTLSLSYSQAHPSRVECLILRGIFTLRRAELEFFYQDGACWLFPDAWEEFVAPIPAGERGDMIQAYSSYLTGHDVAKKHQCALAWSKWEMATSKLQVDPKMLEKAEDPEWALAFARIETHYFVNGGFYSEGALLQKDNIDKIRHIPTVIVQGRYDVVCPMKTSWDLHRAFPEAKYICNPTSGHSSGEADTCKELVAAADAWRDQLLPTAELEATHVVGRYAASNKHETTDPLGITSKHDAPSPTRHSRNQVSDVLGLAAAAGPEDPFKLERKTQASGRTFRGASTDVFGVSTPAATEPPRTKTGNNYLTDADPLCRDGSIQVPATSPFTGEYTTRRTGTSPQRNVSTYPFSQRPEDGALVADSPFHGDVPARRTKAVAYLNDTDPLGRDSKPPPVPDSPFGAGKVDRPHTAPLSSSRSISQITFG